MKMQIPGKVDIKPVVENSLLDKLLDRAGVSSDINGNQRWDDLENVYQTLAQGLVELATQANNSIRLINAIGTENQSELDVTVNGIKQDLETYTAELVRIHARHQGRTGLITEGNDLMDCFGIFQDYHNVREKYHAVLFPSVISITEHVMEVCEKAKKKEDLANVNVVTDVEFKEQ